MSDEFKTKHTPFRLAKWFRDGLKAAMEATDKRPKRTATQIIIEAVCKVEKIKKPKGKQRKVYGFKE